jgi:alpha-L-arabinofuranosidase
MMWRKSSFRHRSNRGEKRKTGCFAEMLEPRLLLTTVTVNAGTTIRAIPSDMIGVNTAPWDGLLNSAQTLSLSEAAGINAVRIGGGSTVDQIHFNTLTYYSNPASTSSQTSLSSNATYGQAALYAASMNATAIVTVDYGEGSPQEAAALLAYLNGSTTNTTSLGMGEQWNVSTQSWQMVNWQTVGYWASLRAATPLAHDDGLNILRINHPASFNFQYWEVGNEVYGSWETDEHGASGDSLPMPTGDSPKAHDPTTLISFAKQFAALAAEISPGILIGYDSQAVDSSFSGWIVNTLEQSASQGFTPGFIADHYYTSVSPGSENDATLLGVSNTSASGNTYDWSQRAADYDNLIHSILGSAGNNVQLIADEVNSISSNPGKQSTSMVNGLFIADAIGSALESTGSNGLPGYQGFWIWDLHNGGVSGNSSSSLYGWRTEGDYGIIGSGSGFASGELSPDYFALQLASKIFSSDGTLVSSSEDNESAVDTFAVLEPNGQLELLVVNKTDPRKNGDTSTPPNNLPDPSLTETFDINGFLAISQATVWQYGVAQDDAQATAPNFASSLANFTTTLSENASGDFSMVLPDYSMTVIQLSPVQFAAQSGSTLNVNLNNFAAISIGTSGSQISVSEAGDQMLFSGITAINVNGSATNNVLNFNGPLTTPLTFIGNGTTTLNVNSGTMNFANSSPITLGTLAIASGASAVMPTQTTAEAQLVLGALSITLGGTLDLKNNEMFINYGSNADPIANIATEIVSGYNGGAWNGAGIISSTAQSNSNFGVGYADSADAGNPASLSADQIKVMYTLLGDANLNGVVDGTDFGILAANFNKGVNGWDQGDFNYSGVVDGTDFGDLSANFNQGIGLSAAVEVVAAAPAAATIPSTSTTGSNSNDSSGAGNDLAFLDGKKSHTQSIRREHR